MTAVVEIPVKEYDNMEAFVQEMNGAFSPEKDVWEQLEIEHPDFTFYQDVNLSSLYESLTENGLTDREIVQLSFNLYGPVIDFYKVGQADDILHVMAVGQR